MGDKVRQNIKNKTKYETEMQTLSIVNNVHFWDRIPPQRKEVSL